MLNTLETLNIKNHGFELEVPVPKIDLDSSSAPSDDPVGHEVGMEGRGSYIKFFEENAPTVQRIHEVDGVKQPVEFWAISLGNRKIFDLVRGYAFFSPIVLAYSASEGRWLTGELSPAYDSEGADRLPDLRVLALNRPLKLLKDRDGIKPLPEMAVMLSAAAASEGPGIGAHDVEPAKDYEHFITIVGAVSLGNTTILEGDEHTQHILRKNNGSTTQGLTDSTLGRIFPTTGQASAIAPGYEMPMVFDPTTTGPKDLILISKSMASRKEGYGAYYNADGTPMERMLAVGMENLYNVNPNASSDIKAISETTT